VKVRQPLAEALVHGTGDERILEPLLPEIAEELNVRRVRFAGSSEGFGRWTAKPNFKTLGPRLGRQVQEVAAALANDDGTVAEALARGESQTVGTPSGEVALHPGDVDLSRETMSGWGVASEGGVTLALELELTEDLRREGIARDLVRLVQDARKAAGLDVSDRIRLWIEAEGDVRAAAQEHRDRIAAETLAVEVSVGGRPDGGAFEQEATIEGTPVRASLERLSR
jgi:isoleucyl-tRNA synthetase